MSALQSQLSPIRAASLFSPCCQNRSQPGCSADSSIQACVCGLDRYCCTQSWDGGCTELATRACGVQCQPACNGQTCGSCLSTSGCRWVVSTTGAGSSLQLDAVATLFPFLGSCSTSCSAQFGWTCHTSSCPDPCFSNPCPNGQQCSISSNCDKPPCFTCSQSSTKKGVCPRVSVRFFFAANVGARWKTVTRTMAPVSAFRMPIAKALQSAVCSRQMTIS